MEAIPRSEGSAYCRKLSPKERPLKRKSGYAATLLRRVYVLGVHEVSDHVVLETHFVYFSYGSSALHWMQQCLEAHLCRKVHFELEDKSRLP